MDIRSLKDEFVKDLEKKGKSFNTVKNYRNDLNCFLDFLYKKQENYLLKDFTTHGVLEYSAHLDHKYNSDNSKRRRVQALRLFFDFLVVNKKWPENPIRKIPVSPKKLDMPKPTEYLDIIKFKSHLLKQRDLGNGLEKLNACRNLIIFYLIYGAGLKVSDITNVKAAHILQGNDGFRIMIVPNKLEPYTITLPGQFEDFYNDYIEKLKVVKSEFKINFDDLLYNANAYRILSGGISTRGLELIFKNLSDDIGIKVTAKSLRQSCILKWINTGTKDSRIKEWMGVKPSYSLKMYKDYYQKYKADCNFTDL